MSRIIKIAIISDRHPAGGEVVVAASTILAMTYLAVKPVSITNSCRIEFINACRVMIHNGTPKKYAEKIVDPNSLDADFADFWLAFDKKGEKLASQIVLKSGRAIDKGKYDFSSMVHLFEHIVPDPPIEGDITPWVGLLAEQLEPWREKIQKMHSDNY
jgi:hypothetical protein